MAFHYKLRHIQKRVQFLSQNFKVILITGARQIGKSTLLKNLLPSVPHITFDRITDVYGAKSNPDLFIKSHRQPLILDEIQYVPELLGAIKRAVDESDDMGQYYLTGSHNLGMLKQAAESMAGRVGIIDLEAFTPFEEFETFSFKDNTQAPLSWLESYLNSPAELLHNFAGIIDTYSPIHTVWRGSFPATMGKSDNAIADYFNSYIRTYIERDALYAHPSAAAPQFHRYLQVMSALTAQEINYALFGRELGVQKKDIMTWEHILKQTYQWREIPAYLPNTLKRLSSRGKGFMTDTGLACYLQGIRDPLSLLGSSRFGQLFETYCVNLIFKLLSGLLAQPFVYHWKTLNDAEVDIVLHMNGKLYPIEIKSTDTPNKYDARGILSFRKDYGDAVQHGIILHAGTHCYKVHEHVTALPFNALMKESA
jgi:predicted AAA+ superfamily ATPase